MKTSTKLRPAPQLDMRWVLGATVGVIVVALLAAVLIPQVRGPAPWVPQSAWPPAGLRISAPEEQGLDSARLAEGLLALRQNRTPIHSLMVVRNGSVLLDAYFYPYDGETPHDLASVTKSIMTTLIGIAADQGKLKLDDPVVSFFPDRTIANLDEPKERITIRHLVSMSSGLDCWGGNTEAMQAEMRASADWVQYGLDLRTNSEPGERFQYCGVGSHLLSAILHEATGMTSLEYARQYLFEPLGIKDVIWPADPQGNNHGWGDLYLHPHDMAKIGYLWLNKGQWDGKQIVSLRWVEDSVQPLLRADEDDYYGYGWWVGSAAGPWEYSAEGNGGQIIMIYPDLDLMVVTTGGGFAYGEAGSVVGAAVPDMNNAGKPLPANPAAVARLNDALTTIAQSPDQPMPVPPLPATAEAISGKTFVFEAGPGSAMKTLRLLFNDSAEAYIEMTVSDDDPERAGPVGLDGVYRISPSPDPNNLPEAYRGRWTNPQTFVLDYNRIANREALIIILRFEGAATDRMTFEATDRSGAVIRAKAKMQSP